MRQIMLGAGEDPMVVGCATGCLEVSTTIYPYTSWKTPFIHNAFENSAATVSGVEAAFKGTAARRQDPGGQEDQVHGCRRRRRHVRHRPAVAVRCHGARSRHGLRLLRQRCVHEHRHPALLGHAEGRMGDDVRGRLRAAGQAAEAQGPHVDHRSARRAVRRAGLDQPLERPHDQGREGVRSRGSGLPQRARDVPSRLAQRVQQVRSRSPSSVSRPATGLCSRSRTASGTEHASKVRRRRKPIEEFLKSQGRFKHLFKPENAGLLAEIQSDVDAYWEYIQKRCECEGLGFGTARNRHEGSRGTSRGPSSMLEWCHDLRRPPGRNDRMSPRPLRCCALGLILVLALALAGCGAPAEVESASPVQRVRVSGSGTALPVIRVLTEEYAADNPEVEFVYLPGLHSSGGIRGVAGGDLDLGAVSRDLTLAEEELGLDYVHLSDDGLVVATHPSVRIDGLTSEQVREIYRGRVRELVRARGPRPSHRRP